MIKNNNPGNIRRVPGQRWQGEIVPVPYVSGFAQFDTLENGYRALIKLLNNYIGAGYDNISQIISRYAPPVENNTAAYIQFVEKYTGINRFKTIGKNDFYSIGKLAKAISEIEHAGTLTGNDLAALNLAVSRIGAPPVQEAGANYISILVMVLIILAAVAKK